MSLPQNLGRLAAGLTADASLNIGVGVTPSGTYKFEVAGTGRFTNSANNATLSLLNNNGYPSIINMSTTTATSTARNWAIFTNGTNWGDLEFKPSSTNGGDPYTTGTVALRLASTGAATFSSSVNIGTNITATSSSIYKTTASSGYLALYGNGGGIYLGGSEANQVFISSGGNVGIGTTSPSSLLQLAGGGIDTRGALRFSDAGLTNYWEIGRDNGVSGHFTFNINATERMRITSGGAVAIGMTSSAYGIVSLKSNSTTPYAGFNVYATGNGNFTFINHDNNRGVIGTEFGAGGTGHTPLAFEAGGSERMRITTGGNVLIGTTTASYSNANRGNLTIGGASDALLALQVGGTARSYFYSDASNTYIDNASGTGNVYVSNGTGGVYLAKNGTSWTSNSDSRLKNINSNIDSAVDKLMTLRAVNFSWKTDSTNKENLGLIAQDVEKVFPQIIDKNILPSKPNQEQADKIEYLGVRYQELVPVLVAAIKEQQQQIKELQSQINK